MGDNLTGLDIRQAFVDAGQEADALLNILPSRGVREFLDRLNGQVFARHTISIPARGGSCKQVAPESAPLAIRAAPNRLLISIALACICHYDNIMDDLTRKWAEQAQYDLDTADAMFKAGRYVYVLFCCQQAVEKALKAVIVKKTGEMPPRIHNLLRLAETAGIESGQEQIHFLTKLSGYYNPVSLS